MPRGRPPKGVRITSDLPELLALWNRALESPRGIVIASQKPNKLVQKLYWARRECGHQAYSSLRIIELEAEVWIAPR